MGVFTHWYILLITLVFWAVVVVGVVWLVLWAIRHSPRGLRPTNNALAILNDRFARGEIDEQEYLKRKAVLSKQ